MSEWITTGQLIDTLKVGEVAEVDKKTTPYSVFIECYVVKTNDSISWCEGKDGTKIGSPLALGGGALEYKWRILPQYVTFEEAMKALREDKKVKVIYPNGEHDYIYSKHRNIDSLDATWNEFLEGKWTIEGE